MTRLAQAKTFSARSTSGSIPKSTSPSRPARSCGPKLGRCRSSLATMSSPEGATTRTSALRGNLEALPLRSMGRRWWKTGGSSSSRGASAELPASFRSAIAERYTVERELGRGGMATVYLARDLKHDRPVALKLLRPELAAILGAERFLREIRLTAQLQHPHILTLIDSGEAEGFLYYVMPYVEGESLRERLEREGQLPLDEALSITRAIASALDFAHGRGVIHRDIKPENVMLHQGEPMVADFGIALAVSTAGRGRPTDSRRQEPSSQRSRPARLGRRAPDGSPPAVHWQS